jgi:hypothetical protein
MRFLLAGIPREVTPDSEVTTVLFHTKTSQEAAKVFLEWFRARAGRASREDVANFADSLESGEFGVSLSRSAFYANVLRSFVRTGLIALLPEFDHGRRRVIKVYRAVIQPIPLRRPPGPSLVYNAHIMSEKWNSQFTSGA